MTHPAKRPARIVLIHPCCIGDVVLATPVLTALRRAYPDAHVTWAVGGWSRRAVEYHPAIDSILDTGSAALPVKSLTGFGRFVYQLRSGHYDLAVSLVRSPLMSAAVWLAGIPQRAGLDSGGRGFGYNIRAVIDPSETRHEAEIYLDVMRIMGISTEGIRTNLPVSESVRESVQALLTEQQIESPYLVVNPAGGSNPGMLMDSKRWPPHYFARTADWFAKEFKTAVILIGGPDDRALINTVRQQMTTPSHVFAGSLSFPQIGALAADAALYLGNDTGLTHLAAASGARTVMILGPSDPGRYAPYTDDSLALWKPVELATGGVAAAESQDFDWARDGISVNEVIEQIRAFMLRPAPGQ